MEQVLDKVPVTILSGQLGSGKSTILRRILTQQTQFKIAIIMNEFAQTASIEGKSIQLTVAKEGTQVQEWLELDCTGPRCFGHRISHATSRDIRVIRIADPSQIALLFWLDSALESLLYLDGIVTVIDCLNFVTQLKEEEAANSGTVTKQIAVADSLYLSKIDLTSEADLALIQQNIRRMNDSAPINQSDEDLGPVLKKLLNLDAFSVYRRVPKSLNCSDLNQQSGYVESELKTRLTRDVGNSLGKNFKTSHNSFSTITIQLPILDKVNSSECKFDKTFRKLIWEGILGDNVLSKEITNDDDDLVLDNGHNSNDMVDEPRILRAKGLLKDIDGNWYVLQAVRDTYEIQLLHPDVPVHPQEHPRLVLIGRSLDNHLGEQFLKAIS